MTGGQPLILKCPVCDTVIQVIQQRGQAQAEPASPWGLELVCCGRPMIRPHQRPRPWVQPQQVPVPAM